MRRWLPLGYSGKVRSACQDMARSIFRFTSEDSIGISAHTPSTFAFPRHSYRGLAGESPPLSPELKPSDLGIHKTIKLE